MNNEYVQYGCGMSGPEGWRNFDASPTLRFERIPFIGNIYTKNKVRFPKSIEYGDIVRGLPVSDNSCKGVYCSHVLEHLSLEDFRLALINTYRILQTGGRFRLVLPDFEYIVLRYVNDPSANAASVFFKSTDLGKEKRSRGFKGFIKEWLGNSQHLWMWDYKGIAQELENAGFCDVRRSEYSDSADGKFREVEDKSRWDNCLGVECMKGQQ